jgi:hypothetical protein
MFKKKKSQSLTITINGISYASPEEMSSGARRIWLDMESQLVRLGKTEYQNAAEAVITTRDEGGRHESHVELRFSPKHHSQFEKWSTVSTVFVLYFGPFAALGFLGILATDVRPIKGNETLWNWVFVGSMSPFVYIFLFNQKIRENLVQAGPLLKRVGIVIGGFFGIGLLYYNAAYSGLPKFLHYVENSEGVLVSRIIDKQDSMRKARLCRPRIELEIISSEINDDVCVAREFFNATEIGDEVKIYGNVSPYAVEPVKLQLISKNMAN